MHVLTNRELQAAFGVCRKTIQRMRHRAGCPKSDVFTNRDDFLLAFAEFAAAFPRAARGFSEFLQRSRESKSDCRFTVTDVRNELDLVLGDIDSEDLKWRVRRLADMAVTAGAREAGDKLSGYAGWWRTAESKYAYFVFPP